MSVSKALATKLHHGQCLPANLYPQGSDYHRAYERCLQLERGEGWNNFAADLPPDHPFVLESMSPIVAARVLGYGLLYAPNDTGRDALGRNILACQDPELAILAYLYVFGLIRVFYNPKGPTPAVTPAFTPRLSLETTAQNTHILDPSSSSASNLRSLALLRDNHRCVFTGKVDMDCYRIAANIVPSTRLTQTNVAHIISQSLRENIDGITPAHQAKFKWARTAGAMIERFGGFQAHDVLGQDNLHSPKNAFIASSDPHVLFDRLEIWLTPAMDGDRVIPDTYDVSNVDEDFFCLTGIDRRVVFRSLSFNGEIIPAPDPRIIELHAACAKIAHMSGAAEHLREFYRDTDSIAVMTQPNAAYELSRALRTLQLVSATA